MSGKQARAETQRAGGILHGNTKNLCVSAPRRDKHPLIVAKNQTFRVRHSTSYSSFHHWAYSRTASKNPKNLKQKRQNRLTDDLSFA